MTYGGEEDNSAIEYIKLSSHKDGSMNILNKITQSMLDLIDLIKPAYDNIISHTAKILDAKLTKINGEWVWKIWDKIIFFSLFFM